MALKRSRGSCVVYFIGIVKVWYEVHGPELVANLVLKGSWAWRT